MCTASLITRYETEPGYRFVFNRDELRSRATGEPPKWREFGPVRAICPRDPDAGGTWIATSDRGLTLAVTNLNPTPGPVIPDGVKLRSRGSIVPMLITATGASEAVSLVRSDDLEAFAPFRLLAVEAAHDGILLLEARWDREHWVVQKRSELPTCFASSGLGDDRVESRRALFRHLQVRTPADQDRFHAHRWPDRPETSVMMSRADARTVSVTTVEVMRRRPGFDIRMEYRSVPDLEVATRSVV
ncbi:MAG: NRDE family protein [Phycisphaerales bacterium]